MAELTVAELRQLVLQRQNAVTAKIGRTRRNNGTNVSGTTHDPRRSRSAVMKYNRAQLQSALARNNTFMSRTTQFYGDANGKPITRSQWRAYQSVERAVNNLSQSRFSQFADTPVPGRNMTAAEHRAATKPAFPVAGNPTVNDPYPTYARKPSQLGSDKALKRLTDSMKRKATPEYHEKVLRDARRVIAKMTKVTGAEDMRRAISKMSTRQFEYLWNITTFAEDTSLHYHLSKSAKEGRKENWLDEVGDARLDDAWDSIRAAQRIK